MTYEYGESITIQADHINSGEAFEASVLAVDDRTDTVTAEPNDLEYAELVIVGQSEVLE